MRVNSSTGMIFIVGIGPGHIDEMTVRARDVLHRCDTIAGYKTYIDLILPLLAGKDIIATGMNREEERCRRALAEASRGKKVALISGGDAGVYGMAGLLLELAQRDSLTRDIAIEVIPGVPAFVAAAAVLGAPLMHDFAVISLSDLLTPWEKIEQRLRAAASADFVTCLYNPKSRTRTAQIGKAVDLFLQYRDAATPCAIVRNISRPGQEVIRTSLQDLLDNEIDMLSLIIIGNGETSFQDNWMITSRGYVL